MNCEELHPRLLEIADGDVPSADAEAVRAHLDQCAACRAQVEELRAGAQALRGAVDVLAPRAHYLTAERLEKLTAAHKTQRRSFKIITLHRLAAAAAVAVIVASAPFLIGDFRHILKPPAENAPMVAEAPAPVAAAPAPVADWHGPVILAATGHSDSDPMNLMRSMRSVMPPSSATVPPGQRVGLAVSDTPGVRVPVENVLYDPEESSHWW